jgi:hypothetical protein
MTGATQTEPQYKLIEKQLTIDGKVYTTYGIEGKSVCFDDASTDKEKVLEMIDRLNREQLEESQFMYFIQDELDR